MPVVLRSGGLRYYFYSNEGSPREPPHVHVKGADCDAKIWLQPEVTIAESYGFNSGQLAGILETVSQKRAVLLRAWDDHFGNSSSV